MDQDPSMRLPGDEPQSAVSWPAVFAGAVAALALSFLLVALLAGFGLAIAPPWPGARPALIGFTPLLGSSMIAVQVLSSALGGYLAGRLRTKWLNVHTHEVHFRDTAHGLLVWAVSTLAGAGVTLVLASPAEIISAGMSVEPAVPLDAARQASILAQFSLFMALGLLLGAFVACVAAAIGGLRRDEMHASFWREHASRP
ncbi:hypothetical protein [Phenylobacterium sp.]|jgi:hypothetical protein|uniref:hypothetical protein n=1 Tax=Phenylobacterium sp. TaxID=1871053 RepID=UPI002F3F0C32